MVAKLKEFSAELKRRHVYTVGAAYVVVGLGVLGAAELILDPLGLEAARPIVVVLTLLGFPLALVLAWAYEVRPDGPTESSPADSVMPESRSASVHDANSIVVLPFANLSPDSDNEYFADGITEEIINAIANVPDLRVIARTSAFAFKGSNRDVRAIGGELGVGTVLEGSVRRAGNTLRITAQLIDVSGGHHLWSERYDRELADVFAIQDEIAQIIADRLRAGRTERLPPSRPTDSLEAYEAFLRGRFYLSKGTPEDYARSVELYEQALALDPSFAQAYVGLAEANGFWDLFFAEDHFPEAKAAAQKALEIDPGMADAHAASGWIAFFYDWDWTASIDAIERALELNPNSIRATEHGTAVLANLGRGDAVELGHRTLESDPLSATANQVTGWALVLAGDPAGAIRCSRRALELSPDFVLAQFVLGVALVDVGDLREAETTFVRMLETSPSYPPALAGLVHAYVRMGRRTDAEDRARELEGYARESPARVALCTAWANADLERVDRAFEWLEQAVEAHDSWIVTLPTFSWWDPLRSDPRFDSMLRRLSFPEWSVR